MFWDRSFAVFLGHRFAESTMREEQMLKNYWRHRVVGGTTFIFLAPEAPLGTQQPSSPAAPQLSSSSRPSGGSSSSSSSSVPRALRGWQSALRFNLNKKRISHFAAAALQLQSGLALSPSTVRAGDGDWWLAACSQIEWSTSDFRWLVLLRVLVCVLVFGFWFFGFKCSHCTFVCENCETVEKVKGEGETVCAKLQCSAKTWQHCSMPTPGLTLTWPSFSSRAVATFCAAPKFARRLSRPRTVPWRLTEPQTLCLPPGHKSRPARPACLAAWLHSQRFLNTQYSITHSCILG